MIWSLNEFKFKKSLLRKNLLYRSYTEKKPFPKKLCLNILKGLCLKCHIFELQKIIVLYKSIFTTHLEKYAI